MPKSALETLREAARLAPSGDNTQPWRIELSPNEHTLHLHLAPERDQSPMNVGQNMARIALGAALENIYQTTAANGWLMEEELLDDSISVRLLDEYEAGTLPPSINERATNRKKFYGKELPQSLYDQLRRSMEPNASDVLWIEKLEDRKRLCDLIAEADSIILSAKPVRLAFLEKVRFDQPTFAVVKEGLSLGSLEVTAFERVALRMMRYIPDIVLRTAGGPSMFRKAAHKLATSASGFCIVTSSLESPSREYQSGRVFQRAWLSLTSQQLAAQPMMSLLVLQNIVKNLPQHEIPTINRTRSLELLEQFQKLLDGFSSVPGKAAVAMLRFGLADRPSVRTGRLGRF